MNTHEKAQQIEGFINLVTFNELELKTKVDSDEIRFTIQITNKNNCHIYSLAFADFEMINEEAKKVGFKLYFIHASTDVMKYIKLTFVENK